MKDGGDSSRQRIQAHAGQEQRHPAEKGARATRVASPAGEELRAVLVQSHVADAEAALSLSTSFGLASQVVCDACETPIEGEPAGRGLYIWARGGETQWEEPALCEHCAGAIVATATRRWESEEEEG